MHTDTTITGNAKSPARQALDHTPETRTGDLLPLADFAIVAIVGYASYIAHVVGLVSAGDPAVAWSEVSRLVWIAAIIAPFLLYAPRFDACISAGRGISVLLGYARRAFCFVAVVGLMGYAGGWFDATPLSWASIWIAGTIALTAATRLSLAHHLRQAVAKKTVGSMRWPYRDSLTPLRQSAALVGDSLAVKVLADRPLRGWNAVMKSIADLVLTSLLCLAALPLLALIAVAIWLDSPGPILFRQRRHGINNHEFDIFKFRSMHVATSPEPGAPLQQTSRDDDRITRVGRVLRKWSLDELPQLFNVLGGSMSLVGPRPHAVNMRTEGQLGDQITDEYPHRHRIKPGITGWSQINGARGATDTVAQLQRRVDLDLYYVEHWSLLLDLKILLLTARAVVRATNAY